MKINAGYALGSFSVAVIGKISIAVVTASFTLGRSPNMKIFKESDVTYTLDAEMDDLQVRGNALVSGDDAEDKKCEDEIIERLNSGDVWAWASVKVTASWRGLEGVDYLGGCSYRDENEFKQLDGYYDDMKARALDDLKQTIKELQTKVCGMEVK